MPKNSRKNRRTTKPNVYAQTNIPSDDRKPRETTIRSTGVVSGSEPRERFRDQKNNQRASVRSEIYTRSLSGELRKMGALSGIIVVVLAVLTFTL